jgi:hypothetical protein
MVNHHFYSTQELKELSEDKLKQERLILNAQISKLQKQIDEIETEVIGITEELRRRKELERNNLLTEFMDV